MRAPPPAAACALAVIVAVLALLWPRAAVTPLSSYDQRFYLGIAYDLRHSGRFTDGFSYAGGGPSTQRPPGMRFTPLYPGFLAIAASFDPALREGLDCVERTAGRDPGCPRAAPVARTAQFLMLAGFYWLLWGAVRRSTGSARAGWIALGLALLTAPLLLLSVNTLMTETMSLLLATAACTLAAEAARHTRLDRPGWGIAWWLGCGTVLGLAALCRPAFLALFWAALAAGAATVAWAGRRSLRHATGLALDLGAFTAGTGLVVLPWMLRNALLLHRFALSFGYASHTLIQRVAFDAMTPRELGLSFVCWLPDGAGLGRLLAGRGTCDRFGWDEHPGSFYSIGTGPLLRQSLVASGGWPGHMHYVVHHYLLADPLKHLLVSLPLALRGMYVDHYWGLLLAPVSILAIVTAARRGGTGVLLLSLPAWILLLFNALVAVNQPRYNLLLILPFSLAGAMLAERWLQRRRRNPGRDRHL